MVPDPAKYVPIDAVADLMSNRNQTVATMSQMDAEAKVDIAVRTGHITPAMKSWAIEPCQQAPASFDAFLEKSAAPYAVIFTPMKIPSEKALNSRKYTGDTDAICAQLGLDPAKLVDGALSCATPVLCGSGKRKDRHCEWRLVGA